MKVLHTADVHVGVSRHGKLVDGRNSRLDDLGDVLERFAQAAHDHEPDLAVIVGDLFDNRRPGPDEIRSVIGPLRLLSEMKMPTLITPGNHDGMGTIADPESHTLGWMAELEMPFVRVLTTPVVSSFAGFGIVAIPFPHKRAYDVTHTELDIAARVELVSKDVESTIAEMARKLDRSTPLEPRLFLGHLTVAGARLGQEAAMRMGWDVMINPDVLSSFDYAALGHIHLQQQVAQNAWYAGSPAPLDWADEGQSKGFLLVDVQRGKMPEVQVLPGGGRPMITIAVRTDEIPALPEQWMEGKPRIDDATVRLVITPTEGERVPPTTVAQLTKTLYGWGAFYVKPEVVVTLSPGRRRVEMDPEADVIDALEQWAEAKGVEPGRVVPVGRELLASFGS